jgi:aldose 1-epimerase
MAFQMRRESRPSVLASDGAVCVLEDGEGKARAFVAPAKGFNCYCWQVEHDDKKLDLLYADPQFFQGAKPTRSGIPILFPFPNRIRAGRFIWAGHEFRLPLNDSTMTNAIHGFACRRPWRVVEEGSDAGAAWVTGEFRGSIDAPDCTAFWPADYLIRITVRLEKHLLRIAAVVRNPDNIPLPFGLGYHPYFRIPAESGTSPEGYFVKASPERLWTLSDSLPTGEVKPVDAARDLRQPRRIRDLELDDVLRVPPRESDAAAPLWQASLSTMEGRKDFLHLETSADFYELVAFTPPHRQAICLEPYTCTTDAINLQQRGVDAGLRVLPPGAEWRGDVVMRLP